MKTLFDELIDELQEKLGSDIAVTQPHVLRPLIDALAHDEKLWTSFLAAVRASWAHNRPARK